MTIKSTAVATLAEERQISKTEAFHELRQRELLRQARSALTFGELQATLG
jgi:hypothetical protein